MTPAVRRVRQRFGSADDWRNIGRWVAPTMVHCFWVAWASVPAVRRSGLRRRTSPSLVIDGHTLLERPGLYDEIEQRVARELRTSTGARPFTRQLFATAAAVERAANRFMTRYGSHGDSFEALEAALRLHQEAVFPWQACFAVGDALEAALRRAGVMDNIRPSISHRQALSMVDHARLQSFQRQLASRGLLTAPFHHIRRLAPRLAGRLEHYQAQTEWIGTHHFWGQPRTMARLRRAIREVDTARVRAVVGRPVPVNIRRLLDLAATAAYWRLQLADLTSWFTYAIRPALRKLGAQSGLTYDEVIWATTDEVLDATHGRRALDPRAIRSRMSGFVLFRPSPTGAFEVLTGRATRQAYLQNFRLGPYGVTTTSRQLRGLVACRGMARGRVAIVLRPHDIGRVKKGMVLVAPETTPDFVPAMKRAAAFVTDLGGITSHAAIVARELNTPCIIGTKVATEVLKDGDLVEVDATKGQVRKL